VGKIIRLKRIATSDKNGTFGVLLEVDREAGDVPFCVTLEPPLVLNKDGTTTPFLSSIPTGIYICRRVDSPRFSNTFEITEVPGRTHILFHDIKVTQLLSCVNPSIKGLLSSIFFLLLFFLVLPF